MAQLGAEKDASLAHFKKRWLPFDATAFRFNHPINSFEQTIAKPFHVKAVVDIFHDSFQTLLILSTALRPALARSGEALLNPCFGFFCGLLLSPFLFLSFSLSFFLSFSLSLFLS